MSAYNNRFKIKELGGIPQTAGLIGLGGVLLSLLAMALPIVVMKVIFLSAGISSIFISLVMIQAKDHFNYINSYFQNWKDRQYKDLGE